MRLGFERSSVRYTVSGVALAALLGGTVTAVALDGPPTKAVTLTVDGSTRVVRTAADDVREVLRRAGVTVGAHDVVAPDLAAPVRDGSRVTVAKGRPLTLFVDGVARTIWVTQPTVGDALRALDMRMPGAHLSASRSGRIPLAGTTVLVQIPKRVTLIADHRRRTVRTTAVTVADLLAERGIRLRPRDRVSVGLTRVPVDGLTVRVSRVTVRHRHVVVRLAYGTRWVADSSLYKGVHEVRRAGRAGRGDRWYRLTYVDGKLAKRKLVRWHRTPPSPRVIAYGTTSRPAPKPVVRSYPSSSGGLNWAALARCESGGNPSIANPPYYGMYQFTLGTWQSVGGSGLPSDASASEQTYRAQLLYAREGRSPWPVCGQYL